MTKLNILTPNGALQTTAAYESLMSPLWDKRGHQSITHTKKINCRELTGYLIPLVIYERY